MATKKSKTAKMIIGIMLAIVGGAALTYGVILAVKSNDEAPATV